MTSLSGIWTSENLTDELPQAIRDWLTSLPQDSRASRSASPESEPGKTIPAICGPQQLSVSGLSNQPFAFLKIHQGFCQPTGLTAEDVDAGSYSRIRIKGDFVKTVGLRWLLPQTTLFGTLEPFSKTWPKAGIVFGGVFYPQPSWERRIKEIGCGFLPSPTVEDAGRQGSATLWNEYENGGRTTGYRLRNFVQMLPTPTSTPGTNGGPNQRDSSGRPGLQAAASIWPTPTVNGNYNRKGLSKKSGDGLATAVKMWPTAQARDGKGAPGAGSRERGGYRGSLPAEVGGQLNPTWVEWLMGWPLGWTDLEPLETDKFRQWRRQFGGY